MYQIITYILVIVFIRQCSISIEDLSGITHAFPSIKTSIALKRVKYFILGLLH